LEDTTVLALGPVRLAQAGASAERIVSFDGDQPGWTPILTSFKLPVPARIWR